MKQIVVLAGGKATRLYPLTKNIPKNLIPINKIPFINHQIKLFKRNGITEIVFCLGKFSEQIIDYLGDGSKFGISIKYSIEKSELLGTLGALLNATDLLSDIFFVTFGDSYLEAEYAKIYDKFLQSNKSGLMTVYKNNSKYVSNNTKIKNGFVIKYDKNSDENFEYVDYGLSLFRKNVLNFFPEKKNLDLTLLNQKLISLNQMASYEVYQNFYEIGSFEGIKNLELYLKTK
tara:strand:- start:193 stop:885 length:693 start_codon:yes stop_codon:yes gene_type:complete